MLTRIAVALTLACSAAWAQDSAFLFQMNCASCHRLGSPTNALLPEALRRMSRQSILAGLELKPIASPKIKREGPPRGSSLSNVSRLRAS